MRPIIRALGGVGTAFALVVGMTSFASADPADSADVQGTDVQGTGIRDADFQDAGLKAIDWKPCPELAEVECGTLRLPIDWSKPRGDKFDLAVARRKATDPAKRIGVMVINPGGPGGSGVDFALGANRFFSPQVQERFDIIGFDPRGVARSQPVKCSIDMLQKQPSVYPANQAEFEALGQYNRDLAADCRKNTGPMFDHADTIGVVDDIDALRRSLGEREINYYGVSYGTLIGQQYAERYGRNIRAMVIDSNMDHSLDTWRFNETEARTAEDSFREFVKWCDRSTSCALHGEDVAKVWDDLLAKADRGEVTDPDFPTRKVTADDIIGAAFGAFYGPHWQRLSELLVALGAGKAAPQAFAVEIAENPFPAVFCQDWAIRVKDHREFSSLVRRARQLAPHMRGSSLGHVAIAGCVGLPEKVNNPQHRLRIKHAPKILMLNALHDPATGYEWAVNAHRQSRDTTVLLTYEGWGHGVYSRSACTRGASDSYLIERKVPRDGTRCAAVEPSAPAAASSGTPHVPVGPKPGLPGWVK
ncbi:pimeloyl-ACP methyl ester carboxylesterase [Saccharothrix tamanrassetensis]|uniref:Pimeloyl-ACP methyl ester carboxylesterase n=1 Tax=Saccharothrix tamanrassetensis TaxID=1051531 RepID=A0A841CIQ1_9PSEU|nr:alpha/beta hydrolase [Saccharothrix tamanrassetensis]MBB5955526.1 pimeloyl-ACP methyl ester carboxylesterase [Saccharothrix tamanrassetensis]